MDDKQEEIALILRMAAERGLVETEQAETLEKELRDDPSSSTGGDWLVREGLLSSEEVNELREELQEAGERTVDAGGAFPFSQVEDPVGADIDAAAARDEDAPLYDVSDGDVVMDGAYILKEKIGVGGMAVVYRAEVDLSQFDYTVLYAYTQVDASTHAERRRKAEDFARKLREEDLDPGTVRAILRAQEIPLPGEVVALKVAAMNVPVARFEAEWKNLLCLNHPNVVEVYGGGTDGGRPYYAMELMSDLVTPQHVADRFSLRDTIRVIIQAGRGLEYLHDRGIIHRDIKPSNLLTRVPPEGDVVTKVSDLGLVKDVVESMGLTGTEGVMGTLPYMPPEQLESSSEVDARSDIYGLGATLYQYVTGKPPFHRKSSTWTLLTVVGRGDRPLSPREHVPDLPGRLNSIILRAMEPDRSERYGSVGEFLDDLRSYLREAPPEATSSLQSAASDAAAGEAAETSNDTGAESPDGKQIRRRVTVAAAVTVLLFLLGTAYFVLFTPVSNPWKDQQASEDTGKERPQEGADEEEDIDKQDETAKAGAPQRSSDVEVVRRVYSQDFEAKPDFPPVFENSGEKVFWWNRSTGTYHLRVGSEEGRHGWVFSPRFPEITDASFRLTMAIECVEEGEDVSPLQIRLFPMADVISDVGSKMSEPALKITCGDDVISLTDGENTCEVPLESPSKWRRITVLYDHTPDRAHITVVGEDNEKVAEKGEIELSPGPFHVIALGSHARKDGPETSEWGVDDVELARVRLE
ncbi:MAG: serine/threonine protein kinase [Candidatus Brocadiia bacterium]